MIHDTDDDELLNYFGDTKPVAKKRSASAKKLSNKKRVQPGRRKRVVQTEPEVKAKSQKPVTESQPDRRDHLEVVRNFFQAVNPDTDLPIYVGIDPGLKGALGLIHPDDAKFTTAIDIPTMQLNKSGKTPKGNVAKKTIVDVATLWSYLEIMLPFNGRIVFCLEKMQAHKTDTGVTGFSIGCSYGMWPLFLHSHGFVLEEVLPVVWKRAMHLLKKDKSDSRLMAQRMFPAAPLLRSKDDGRAEALLVAEVIKRRRNSVE